MEAWNSRVIEHFTYSIQFSPPASLQAVSIRIVTDRDGKPKGFGYIEFDQADALRDALSRSGSQLAGRSIRVGVAEAPKAGERGFGSSIAEEASQWRRAGPLPPAEGAPSRPGVARERSGFGGPGGRPSDGPSGFDNMEVGSGGRSGFGSKFQASPAPPARDGPMRSGPPGRMGGPPGPAEPLEPTKGEVASDWRTGKPTESSSVPAAGPRRGMFGGAAPGGPDGEGPSGRSPSFRQRDATEVDERFASQERMGFGSKFTPTPPESPAVGNRAPRAPFERKPSAAATTAPPSGPSEGAVNWRSARPTPPAGPSADSPAVTPPSAPAERKKLDLKPRSAAPAEGAETPGASSTNKSNPFGGAKPVDVMERERQIEERLQAQREQRAAEEKAKQEKIKAEKAEKEAALKGAPTGPRADRDKAGGAAGAPTGPRSAGTGRTPSKRGESVKSPTADAATAAPTSEAAAGAASTVATPTSPAAAPAIKSPPAAGAWGKGRKASGALLGNSATAAAPTNGSAESKNGDDVVAEVSEGVAKAQVAE